MNWLDIVGAAASGGTAVGVFLAWWQIRESRRINRTQFEDNLAQHYREIIHDIPVRALLGEKLQPKEQEETLRSFYRYIDLTNDQIFLRQQGRVSEQTWENWRDGMRTLMFMPAFDDAWRQIKDKPTTKFDELRRLEISDYEDDPYLWKDTWRQVGVSAPNKVRVRALEDSERAGVPLQANAED